MNPLEGRERSPVWSQPGTAVRDDTETPKAEPVREPAENSRARGEASTPAGRAATRGRKNEVHPLRLFRQKVLRFAWLTWGLCLLLLVIQVAMVSYISAVPLLAATTLLAGSVNLLISTPRWRRRLAANWFLLLLFGSVPVLSQVELVTDSQPITLLLYLFPIAWAAYYHEMRGAMALALTSAVVSLGVEMILAHHYQTPWPSGLGQAFLVLAGMYLGQSGEELRRRLNQKKRLVRHLQAQGARLRREVRQLMEDKVNLGIRVRELDEEVRKARSEARYQAAMVDLSQSLFETLELEPLLEGILVRARELVGYHSAAIFLYDWDRTQLYCARTEGFFRSEMEYQLHPEMGLPAAVAHTRRPVILADLRSDPRFRKILATARVESALYVPLAFQPAGSRRDGAESFGCLALWSMEPGYYNEESLNKLSLLTRLSSRTLKNVEVFAQVESRLLFITSLWEVSKTLSSAEGFAGGHRAALEEALESVRGLFGADRAIFFHQDERENILDPYVVRGFPEEAVAELRARLRADRTGAAPLTRSLIQSRDASREPRLLVLSPVLAEQGVRSVLWIPLLGHQAVLGAIGLFSDGPRTWSSEETRWLEIFASLISTSLENTQLLHDLVSQKNRLQVLVDSIPEGVFMADAGRRVLTWNAAAARITGWRLDEVLGQPCSRFIACQTDEFGVWCEARCPLRAAVQGGSRVDSGVENVVLLTRGGQRVPVFLTSAPIYGEEGRVAGSILVFRDMTREREIEAMKEEFLATITHDLKSPLASILGYTELLCDSRTGVLSPTHADFVGGIIRASKTLQLLINNLLQSARMEAGRLEISPSIFDLQELAREIEEMFRPLLAHKELRLEVDIPAGLRVHADRERIQQVLLNLLSNAVKFTPRQGSIRITARPEGDRVALAVADTGKGMPSYLLERLFQKFSQGEKGGTGLGLYIVRKVLEAHGEEILVESEVGRGTTFSFHLPIFSPARGEGAPRVLIVASDPRLVRMLQRFLELGGFRAPEADSSAAALRAVRAVRPQLVVVDSASDSGELVQSLRSQESTRDIPLILVCDRTEEVPPGFAAFVYKPVDHQDLLRKVRAVSGYAQAREP
ncbi:MAG TPA: ATP-binding protein [Candidatus Nitrosotenuis sp.]|nr:ATP-binding protein [Candidatus Nitrosotenuis sp.]